jgi:hypothetical protein
MGQGTSLAVDVAECLSWPFSADPDGIGWLISGGKRLSASRFTCWERHGRPPSPKHHDEHSCGNAWCVNAGHLRWARGERAAENLPPVPPPSPASEPIMFEFSGEEAATMLCALAEPEPGPVDGAARLAAIMADPILSDSRWPNPIRPSPARSLSDESWAQTLEEEARCRRRATVRLGYSIFPDPDCEELMDVESDLTEPPF